MKLGVVVVIHEIEAGIPPRCCVALIENEVENRPNFGCRMADGFNLMTASRIPRPVRKCVAKYFVIAYQVEPHLVAVERFFVVFPLTAQVILNL